MIRPGTIGWFALHEARLAWRDWLSLVTAGHRRRTRTVALACIAFVLLAHGLAWLILASSANVSGMAGKHALVVITGMLLAAWSMMLSQAMEAVTRAFYTRGDLDLILTSPATASRLFAARIVAMVVTIMFMTLVLGAPFINVLVWRGGVHWLGTYVVIAGLAMDAVAVAAALAVALFRGIGPRRTRAIAQIVAAVIGAAFAIAVQFAAISSFGTMSRMAVLQSPMLMKFAPDVGSAFWWPARAALGEPAAMAAFLGVSVVVLVSAIHVCAPRFGTFALAVASVSHGTNQRGRRQASFHSVSPTRALRRKEWTLLLRDPWLMSQTLMQLLYLLPAAFLLWRGFYARGGASSLLVPVLIVAAGQLSGALAWLAVSGEDAPELVASAPVSAARVLRAKRRRCSVALPSRSPRLSSCLRPRCRSRHWSRSSALPSRPARPRRSNSGFARRRGAAFFGAVRPHRASLPMPRRCRRSAGLGPERSRRREPGSPYSLASSYSRSLAAPG